MDNQSLLVGLIVGLLIGAGIGYLAWYSPMTGLQNQINTLQTQVSSYKTETDKIPGLRQQIANLTNDKTMLTNEKASLSNQIVVLQSKVDNFENDKKLNTLNVTKFVDYLTAKKGQPWEPSANNPDIQAVLFVQIANQFADDLVSNITNEIKAKGGVGHELYRYYSAGVGGMSEDVENNLSYNAEVKAVIDHYGIEHVAVVYIGSFESFQTLYNIFSYPSKFPSCNSIPWFYIDGANYGYLFSTTS